jgi:hypothetical protein
MLDGVSVLPCCFFGREILPLKKPLHDQSVVVWYLAYLQNTLRTGFDCTIWENEQKVWTRNGLVSNVKLELADMKNWVYQDTLRKLEFICPIAHSLSDEKRPVVLAVKLDCATETKSRQTVDTSQTYL